MTAKISGRLSTLSAAFVVARRDFMAILFSRSFIFFLLGPLFPVIVGGLAGNVGQRVQQQATHADLGIAMEAQDVRALLAARQALEPHAGYALPDFAVIRALKPGERFDAVQALKTANVAAIVTGTPAKPVLTGPQERIEGWKGPLALIAAQATGEGPRAYPEIALSSVVTSKADQRSDQLRTAQAAQMLLFLLTMLLAGMVLSNLVEEKGNKIIEILAAAIPMDAVFFGKLFAMLAVSLVGICVWGGVGGAASLATGGSLDALAAPAVGWPLFLLLGVIYFAMAYLLIGSVFLAIGSLATTVREVQTLSMPATMLQLIVFFIAAYAVGQPGSPVELGAVLFPFSSPFAMLARAAQDATLWTHLAAIAWQALCVALLVRGGAKLFRTRVMQSGPQGGKKRPFWKRAGIAAADASGRLA